MTEKKIIAVVGATGTQGGGFARAILNDPNREFRVRAITRKPDSDKAKALAAAGAEIVIADLNDVASVTKAFTGAYGAFCVTNYWELFDAEKEKAQAQNLAAAAQRCGIKHTIWSTLEDTREFIPLSDNRMPTLYGKYKVPHFDGKGEADAYFKEAHVPTTCLRFPYFWENMIYFGTGPQKGPDGKYYISYPMGNKKMAGIGTEDIGQCILGVFKVPGEFIGKTVGVAGDELTIADMAATLSKVLGKEILYNSVSAETYRGFGFPGADDMGNMFQFYADFEEYLSGARSVALGRRLNPKIKNFEQWARTHAARIPLK
jgi:uncharacterized protein YbjT (DUF2867 family)